MKTKLNPEMFFNLFIILLGILFLFYNCSLLDSTAADLTGGKSPDNNEKIIPTELEGTWKTVCRANETDSDLIVFKFSGNSWDITAASFTDTVCNDARQTQNFGGTFEIGGDVNGLEGAKEINFTFNKFQMTLHAQEYVDYYSSSLGITTAIDEPFSVLGVNLDGFLINDGDTMYEIFKIDGDNLYFGDGSCDGPCKSEAERPTVLDTEFATKE
jgi:hypothetical protein